MSRYKLHAGHYSTHVGWCLGIRFESESYGGYSTIYGWPQKTWYIVVSIGHQSYCAGFYLRPKTAVKGTK